MVSVRLLMVLLLGVSTSSCLRARRMPVSVVTSPRSEGSLPLYLSARGDVVVSRSVDTPGRRMCKSVMVIAAETVRADEQLLSTIESTFISSGIRVFSTALTGRVVPKATPNQVESAAKLPTLERALILAKESNVECVFYFLGFHPDGTAARYFIWPYEAQALVEVDRSRYDKFLPSRRWVVDGPQLRVEGKVIDVDNGSVLTIVSLSNSTPFVATWTDKVAFADQSLIQDEGNGGWTLSSPEDLLRLQASLLLRVAVDLRGSATRSPPSGR